jgi:hypothetical protein
MTQTATQITIAEFNQTISAIAHDLRAEREHYGSDWIAVRDVAYEMSADSQWTIYTGMARDLVTALRVEAPEIYDEACELLESSYDNGHAFDSDSFDLHIAHCAVESQVIKALEAMKSQDYANSFAEALDWIVSKARRDLFDLRDEFEYDFARVGDYFGQVFDDVSYLHGEHV